MELADHQVLYALHADTDNVHLHVVVNRVDPDTGKVKKINRGFDIESVHRVVVRIEHAQGWTVEDNKRYRLNAKGELERTDPDRGSRPRHRSGHRDTGPPPLLCLTARSFPGDRWQRRTNSPTTPLVTQLPAPDGAPRGRRDGPRQRAGGNQHPDVAVARAHRAAPA